MACVIISILLRLQWTHQHNCSDWRTQRCPYNGVTVFGTRNSPELWQDVMQYSQIKSTSSHTHFFFFLETKPKAAVEECTKNYEPTPLVCKYRSMFTKEHVSAVYICFNPQRSLILPLGSSWNRLQKHHLHKHLTVSLGIFQFLFLYFFSKSSHFEGNMVKPAITN